MRIILDTNIEILSYNQSDTAILILELTLTRKQLNL